MISEKTFTYRKVIFCIAILLIVCSILIPLYYNDSAKSDRVHHHMRGQSEAIPINSQIFSSQLVNSEFVNDAFATHLPLVIIDINGQKLHKSSIWDQEKRYRVPTNEELYVNGEMLIIDNENGVNTLRDKPTIDSNIKIRLRGNSSLDYDKKQYYIKMVDKDGNKNKKDIMGMGSDWEWVLNISFIDKSLIRNYMCFNIAAEIMPYTPDLRYCEVVIKDGTNNRYQGVYLMMESVKQGKDRLNITGYKPQYQQPSYLLRRDRYDESGNMLENYATINGLTKSFLDIKYPSKKEITEQTYEYIQNDIDQFEKSIFSNNPQEFYKYSEYINVESFVDYFIMNEFFSNYDAGYNSTYIYKHGNQKISMGPVWDFDQSMDNYHKSKLEYNTTAMHDAPWFRQLLRDGNFVDAIISRYAELRKGVLSDEYLTKYIEETVLFLGKAQQRDWERWKYFYEDPDYMIDSIDEYGNVIERSTLTYEAELAKMEEALKKHGEWMDEHIDSLYQFNEFDGEKKPIDIYSIVMRSLFGEDRTLWASKFFGVLFVITFIVIIIIVQRERL